MNTVQDNQASQNIGSLARTLPGQVVLVLQGGGALARGGNGRTLLFRTQTYNKERAQGLDEH